MRIIKKIFKTIGMILLIFIGLLLLALVGIFIYHRIKMPQDKEFLKEQGYYSPVSVGDHSLNLIDYGGATDEHRIIALGGLGPGFPLELRTLADELKKTSKVYYLARPGFDGSDDTDMEMTAAAVVEEYRSALKNAGVEAPYVLMPHSYANLPATYWVSKYPEEIEALISLDGSPAKELTPEQKQEAEEDMAEAGLSTVRTLIDLGIGDVALRLFIEENPDYSEDEQRVSDIMQLLTLGSKAYASNMANFVESTDSVWQMMQPNDVPKLYINSSSGYRTVEEIKADEEDDFEGSDEERQKKYEEKLEDAAYYREHVLTPYTDKLGNCKVVDVPGDHWIHSEKPEKCAEVITEFLNTLK